MPRWPSHEKSTRFSELLDDYRWSRRLTPGQLAIKIGISRQTLNSWLHQGKVPYPATLAQIATRLNIPLATLYKAADIPVPRISPAQQEEEEEYLREYWDWWIADSVEIARANMRAEGIDEKTIEQTLQRIVADFRRRQHGKNYVPYVQREFAMPPPERIVDALPYVMADGAGDHADDTEQPTQILQALQGPKPKPPEHQERRAPRKRATAPPRKSPRSSPDR